MRIRYGKELKKYQDPKVVLPILLSSQIVVILLLGWLLFRG
jgi:hypothetical protein